MGLRVEHDLHIHSNLSLCAKPEMTFENIASVGRLRGFSVIGVCDHIDVPGDGDRERRLLENFRLAHKVAADAGDGCVYASSSVATPSQDAASGVAGPSARQCQARQLHILVGSEVTMLSPGKLAISAETARQLDYISVATNHYHMPGVEHPYDRSAQGYAGHHLEMLESVCDLERGHVVVHPFISGFTRVVEQQEFFQAIDRMRLRRVLAQLAERGIRLELNLRVPAERTDFFSRVVQIGKEVGLRFSLGSDAHRLSDVCFADFPNVAEALEGLGLTEDQIAPPVI